MSTGNLQAALFILNRPEPIRQSSLLMVLATGIGDARTLIAGLKALSAESRPPWSNRINQLQILLEQGQTLSESLTSVTGLLPEPTLVAIRVAEETGSLQQVLAEEAHRLMSVADSGSPVQPTLASTLTWVALVGMLLTALIALLMFSVVPKFEKIFADFDVDMPDVSKLLISFSQWFVEYWYIGPLPLVTVVAFSVFHFIYWQLQFLSTGRVLFAEHWPRYWSPLILRLLGITVATGNDLGSSVHGILKELRPGRAAIRLSAVRMRLSAGEDCWLALQAEGFLTERETMFLNSSRQSQHLDWGLIHLSRTLERRRSRWISVLPSIIQPAVVLVAGFVVAFICVGMFLPLVKLVNDFS